MSTRTPRGLVLAASMLFCACAPLNTTSQLAPNQYAQTRDSATSACLRNPACYAPPPGEQAILPWLSRSVDAARTTAAVLRLLEVAELAKVEQILKDCADQASHDVNERLLGKSQRLTRQLCRETFETKPGGHKVTWGMHLGREKHQFAMECVQEALGETFSENVSLQPRYKYDTKTGRLQLFDPRQVDEWLRDGLFHKLLGTLIPDVVLHAAGDLLRIQAIFDFKLPCPSDNPPSWHEYHPDHPFYPSNQKAMYEKAFSVAPKHVRPGFGVGE